MVKEKVLFYAVGCREGITRFVTKLTSADEMLGKREPAYDGLSLLLGILYCFLLFSLLFLGQHSGLINSTDREHHGEIGLLLFVIPEAIASYLSSRKRLLCPCWVPCTRCHSVRWYAISD